nr:hypothetical protein BaRGS_009011 [Batillaria attramentaria]
MVPSKSEKSRADQGPGTDIGEALKAVLQQAFSQQRVTCSLTECVEVLSTRPDDVMLCVMPVLAAPDAVANIQSTLIRAVCREHCIRLVSVDCDVKLAKIVCSGIPDTLDNNCNIVGTGCDDNDNLKTVNHYGFPCALIQYPSEASTEDETVAEFCKEQLYGHAQDEPYIELPD